MESLFGLPAHPLLVHAPVVLMPLTLIVILVLSARPWWRLRLGAAMVGFTLVTFISTLFARSSGNALDAALNESFFIDRSHHEQLGDQTALALFVLTLCAAITFGLDRWNERKYERGTVSTGSTVFMTLTVLSAIVATIWMIRTGHEGAVLVHDGKI